jgi:transposase
MDSFQLRYILLKTIPTFTAVCASDQLKDINQTSFAVICNNESSSKSGMHWISFFKENHNSPVEFFDSFGLPISFYSTAIQNFCRKGSKHIESSTSQFQSNMSDFCGNYCCFFLIHRSKGIPYEKIVEMFSDTDLAKNDEKVDHFIRDNFDYPKFSNCQLLCKEECLKRGVDFSNICIQRNGNCFRSMKKLFP